jgi:hypothetical protein
MMMMGRTSAVRLQYSTAADPSRLGGTSPVALPTVRCGARCSPSTGRSRPLWGLRFNASYSHVSIMRADDLYTTAW